MNFLATRLARNLRGVSRHRFLHRSPFMRSFSTAIKPQTKYASTQAIAVTLAQEPSAQPWASGIAAMAALFGAAELLRQSKDSTAHNCGIVGVIGTDDAREVLLEGLQILRNRGYDSAGLCTLCPEKGLVVTKYASRGTSADSVELLEANSGAHRGHRVGIAHTRWATHGGKTDQNAHPHTDMDGRVALVHNGTINNAHELRKELENEGVRFSSETDSEVIAQLVGRALRRQEAPDLRAAVDQALDRCDGSWGLAVVDREKPDEIVVARNGSPMVLGLGQGKIFIASEHSAFSRHTKNYIALKDGETGVVSPAGCSLDLSRVQKAPHQEILLSPAPYEHWTLRELMEQPEAVARALSYGGRLSNDKVVLGGPDRNIDTMRGIKHLLVSACGTSLYAGMYGAKLMRDLASFHTVQTCDAAEVRTSEFPLHNSGLLVLSQSGETKDVHNVVKQAQKLGIPMLSVVNAVGSLIARETGLGVYLNAGRENAVASTKAFTTQVTVMALLAIWFSDTHHEATPHPDKMLLFDALQRLPISFGMALRLREECKAVAAKLRDKRHCFVLGRGYGEPVALEGALKLKEMAYLHAEGYSGGALKHGPFALIEGAEGKDGSTPIIMIILDDEHANHMRTAAMEVKARHADVTVITDNPRLAEGIDPRPLVIPANGALTACIAVLPLQMIAYELAVLRGINPDTPRNLAKAVTVD